MGTDIHLYVERRTDSGTWEALAPPPRDLEKWPKKANDYGCWGPGGCMAERPCFSCRSRGCPECLGTGRDIAWYCTRSYRVFSILADVRNGYGFAGIKTGERMNVIAPPRGLPEDVTEAVRQQGVDHTPSWLTLAEILQFDWRQGSTHVGVITWDEFVEWAKHPPACPDVYSGDVSGPRVRVIDEATARAVLEIDRAREARTHDSGLHVRVEWREAYADAARSFLDFVDCFLRPLGKPEDVRIIFWFDS